MTHGRGAARIALLIAVAAAAALACQTDRDRPGPPRVGITLDQDSVNSPDELTGSVRADDPDGIDSLWISVDSATPLGADGLLQPSFEATFRADVPAGHGFGDRVPVSLKARDISGYVGGLDTFVIVKGP
jgi:hypothetical protein